MGLENSIFNQTKINCDFIIEMSETTTKTKTEKCKVLIIGAGMAGNILFVSFIFHFIDAIISLAH